MNKTNNSRLNKTKQGSGTAHGNTYSGKYQANRRDALQSAKVRNGGSGAFSNVNKGRPSSFNDSALPDIHKATDGPSYHQGGTSSRRNSGTGSVNSFKPKVSPEPPGRQAMSNDSVKRSRTPNIYSSQQYGENRFRNNVQPHYAENDNPRNGRNNQNDYSRGNIPNGDINRTQMDQQQYNSSNRQYDYMKPFVGTYPDSHIPQGHGPSSNRAYQNYNDQSQSGPYTQAGDYHNQRNSVEQETRSQQPTHQQHENHGEYFDRRDMQPLVQRSPRKQPDNQRTNDFSDPRRGNFSERSGPQRPNGPMGPPPGRNNFDMSPPGPRKPPFKNNNSNTQQQSGQTSRSPYKDRDGNVQYVLRNRKPSNDDFESRQSRMSQGNSNSQTGQSGARTQNSNGTKPNSKGYEFPEVADVDDFDINDIGAEYGGNDIYLCYLKTDAGDVIGPLRLDIEDVQLGLPRFKQENIDNKEQNEDPGMRNRQSGSHGLNEFSSRSHSMLTLTVDTEQVDPEDENLYLTKRGKLTFVDLAGSEKVKDSGSSAEMLIESNNINRSLLVLGNCISSLGDPKKRQGHIPYRDSKLTKLLADSLGGNGVTLMIACVTPSAYHVHETTNTLRYASRAKRIKSKPVVKMDPREKLILSLKRELKVLRNENHYLREQLEFPAKPKGDLQKNNDEKFMKMVKDMQSKEVKPTKPRKVSSKTASPGDRDLYAMLQEYMIENEALRNENSELHRNKDQMHRDQQSLSKQNERLSKKFDDMQKTLDKVRHNGSEPGVQYRSPQGSGNPGYAPPPQRLPQNQGYVSPNTGRGKPPPSHGQPKRPPHRLSEPLMRPAQLPPDHIQNGYVDEGYMSPRGRPPIQNGRQESPMRAVDSRRSSQSSTADTIKNINDKLKKELYDLDGQINHHHLVNARNRSIYGSQTSMHSIHR